MASQLPTNLVLTFALPRRRSPVRTRCSAPLKPRLYSKFRAGRGSSFQYLDPSWTLRDRFGARRRASDDAQVRIGVPTEKSIRTGRVNVRGTGRADGQR